MFKSGVTNTNKKGKLKAYSSISNIDYIKTLRKVIYNINYVFDLSFLNMLFIIISI
jgi:hypothetical protein